MPTDASPHAPPTARVQVLGLCRFSLLGEGGFQVTHAGIAERRAFLYDPQRLGRRFVWFEHVVLPCLRAQTDPDFRLVVLTGEDFPEPFRSRLAALAGTVPQIVLDFRPPGPHRDLCRQALQARIDPAADVVAQFRLDDDDAVAVDYVERLRRDFASGLEPIYGRLGRLSLDYASGLVLDSDGPSAHRVIARDWTPALTLFLPPGSARAVLDYPHHKLLHHMPGVSLQDNVMFVRGKHEGNDSHGWAGRLAPALAPGEAADILRRRFGIDLGRFAAALRP